MMLPQAVAPQLKRHMRAVRRRAFESVGSDRYSRPSLHGIEEALDRLFDHPGFFVEAGAFDGFEQSNTYWLERFRGWRGILVEPVPDKAAICRRLRKRSKTFQCALVPPEGPDAVTLRYAGLMSLIPGARGNTEADEEWIASGLEVQGGLSTYKLDVPARTLNQVLEALSAPASFELLSLDVEGHEVGALAGLDVSSFSPRYILVERNDPKGIHAQLTAMGYALADDAFTPQDALYVRS
jgi:FkbM family methyltransferase